jgi:hypothetical protein
MWGWGFANWAQNLMLVSKTNTVQYFLLYFVEKKSKTCLFFTQLFRIGELRAKKIYLVLILYAVGFWRQQ